ncbi:MAG: VanW family protein [Anaerovoracaceae bacterium]|nr:VanW family protein [Anaerovoracaceae bacterium]
MTNIERSASAGGKGKRQKRRGRRKLAAIIIVLAVIAAGAGIYAYMYSASAVSAAGNRILKGVDISGIDVGGLTKDEASEKLHGCVTDSQNAVITLKAGERTRDVKYSSFSLRYDEDQAVDDAYSAGRSGGPFRRFAAVKRAEKGKCDIPLDISVSDSKIKSVISVNESRLVSTPVNAYIVEKNGKGEVVKGKKGHKIIYGDSVEKVKNAVTTDWTGKDKTVKLETKKSDPDIKASDLKDLTDIMGTYQTSYKGSPYGRCKNIENGASILNGVMVQPGEEFSMYETVTPFSPDNGYYLAGTIVGEKHIDDYGGGICQVSTTLYNAVIRSELDVTERHNHSLMIGYVPASADASIASKDFDFKFKNNKDDPVYISAHAGGGSIKITIFGHDKRPANRTVQFESVVVNYIPYGTKVIKKDKTLEEGKKKVDTPGQTGCNAQLWKIVIVNGHVKSRTKFNTSHYNKVDQKVIIGTKKKADKNKDKNKDKDKDDSGSNGSDDSASKK